MTFLNVVQRPNATTQTGLGTNTVVGAATMDDALSDASDSSYVFLDARASLDTQVVRVSIAAPVLASNTRVYSVGVQVRVQSVLVDPNNQPPLLLGWLRTNSGAIAVSGQTTQVNKTAFYTYAPADSVGGVWSTIDLGQFTSAPDGTPWDATAGTGNLANLSVDLGRGDDLAANLYVAALYVTVYYQQQATLTLTAPTSPSSATQATMKWTYASANFAAQTAYRNAVYTQAQTLATGFSPFVTPAQFITGLSGSSVATSWWQLGAASQWTTPGDLTDGIYVGYAQAISQWPGAGGDFTTPITSITWTRTGAPAGPPATAVLNSAAYSYTDMRTYITMTPGGTTPATVAFSVIKSTDGVTWSFAAPSLTYIPANGMSSVTVADRFPLLNLPTQYKVIAYSGSPLVAAAAPSSPITVTPVDNRYLLHHPTNNLLDTQIFIQSPKGDDGVKVTKRRMQGTYYFTGGPVTRAVPMMTWGPTYGREWALTLWFDMTANPTLWSAVDALDEASCPLYFQLPTGEAGWIGMGPGASGQDTEDTFQIVPGNTSKYRWKRRKVIFTEISAPSYF